MSLRRMRRSTVSELETQKSWRCSSSLKNSRILLIRKRYEVLGRQAGMSKVTQLARTKPGYVSKPIRLETLHSVWYRDESTGLGPKAVTAFCTRVSVCLEDSLDPLAWECRPYLLGRQSSQGGISLREYAWQQILLFPNSFFPWGNPVLASCMYIILQAHSSDRYQLT